MELLFRKGRGAPSKGKSIIETDKKESLHEKLIDNEKEIIKKGMVKEMKEMFERQNCELKDGTLRKGLDIGKDIVKQIDNLKKDDSPRNYDDSLKELHGRQNSKDVGKVKDMQKPKTNSSKESLRRKIEIEERMRHEREKVKVHKGRKNYNGNLKEKANSDSVVKVKMEVKDKKCNSFKEEIDERLKTIDRTENHSLIELAKKIEILSTPMETDRKRDITVLNTIELSDVIVIQ